MEGGYVEYDIDYASDAVYIKKTFKIKMNSMDKSLDHKIF